MTDLGNMVVGPRSQRGKGKKIDVWEVKFPGDVRGQVDVYMQRDAESEYTFHCELDPARKHPFAARFSARTPTELRDMLNLAATEHIQKNWRKQLLVEFDSYGNDRTEPEDEGVHELKMEWHVVYGSGTGRSRMYLHDGELYTRDCAYGRRERGVFLDWTQKREDVLRELGSAIHQAHTRLEALLEEDQLGKALDSAGTGRHLLTEGK